MLIPRFSSKFKKDYKRMSRSGNDIKLLDVVLHMLINEITLPETYRDHGLQGKLAVYRECHIQSDWLLMYKIQNDEITFARTGTHADLFN